MFLYHISLPSVTPFTAAFTSIFSSDLKLKTLQSCRRLAKTRPHPRHNTRAAISSPRFGCSPWIVLLCFIASTETSHWIAALYSVTDSTQHYPAFRETASLNISPLRWEEKPGRGWRREECFLFIFAEPESAWFSPPDSISAMEASRPTPRSGTSQDNSGCRRLPQADYLGWSRLEIGVILLVPVSGRWLRFIPLFWEFTLSSDCSGARLRQDFVRGERPVHSLEMWHHPRKQQDLKTAASICQEDFF